MTGSRIERDRRNSARVLVPKALLLTAFALAMFLAGRLWSLREAREAQRAAGLAEQERLAVQAELTECRNARLLQRTRGDRSGGDSPEESRDHTSRVVGNHHSTGRRETVRSGP
jgi:hypothetical protein